MTPNARHGLELRTLKFSHFKRCREHVFDKGGVLEYFSRRTCELKLLDNLVRRTRPRIHIQHYTRGTNAKVGSVRR